MMNPSELLLTSSVLILAVLALRHFGRGRLSRRLCYGLWLVVLLRLLVPVSLPSQFMEGPDSSIIPVRRTGMLSAG